VKIGVGEIMGRGYLNEAPAFFSLPQFANRMLSSFRGKGKINFGNKAGTWKLAGK